VETDKDLPYDPAAPLDVSAAYDRTWYSGYDSDESLRLIERAGMSVLHSEIDDPQSRGHFSIIATTPPSTE
jgi:hypothetical protein